MAVLSQAERARVLRWAMRDPSLGPCSFTKPDLVAAVAALDQFLDDNASAVNSALPQPFRGSATTPQKALLLAYVVLRRYGGGLLQDGGD